MEYKHLLSERKGHILVLTLNRDEARNAINLQLSSELRHAMEAFEADPELRVAILTHAGNCFCAGADLKEIAALAASGKPTSDDSADSWGFASLTRHVFNKPVIAAINGKALGGGTEIALAMDLVVASENSMFGLPEVARGLMAAGGAGISNIIRQIPFKVALEMIFTGQPVTAARAYELGLVNRVVPGDRVMESALELAGQIGENAPLAVKLSKEIAYRCLDAPANYPPASWDISLHYKAINDASLDAREGPRAFAEKRKPVWKNR